MPELPEVETIKLGLQQYVVGKTIADVEIRSQRIFSGDAKHIIGTTVTNIRRFGKGLVIDLDNGFSIAVHVKLTGQLIYQEAGDDGKVSKVSNGKLSAKVGGPLPNTFTRAIFKLKVKNEKLNVGENAFLFYNDLRQFGWIKIVESAKVKVENYFKELGPEPPVVKDVEDALTLETFTEIVKKGNVAIKVVLMDQKRISGIGNIYANDALWHAKIDPARKAKTLVDKEIKALYDAILFVLKKGLATGGASELQFVNVLGEDGGYQKHFLAYGKQGKPCARCGTLMKKITLGGRGTYFCPQCQK